MEELRIIGGDVALDLVNTVEPRIAGVPPERDHLSSPDALLSWAERAGLVDAPTRQRVAAAWSAAPEEAAAALLDVLRIRDAAGALLDAARAQDGDAASSDAADLLMHRAADALSRSRLEPDPDRRHPMRRRFGHAPATLLADRLAVAAVETAQTADVRRLKACPPDDGGCGWLFIDTSKNASRRWCSMDDCGSRAKSRRLTGRRRDARSTGRQPTGPQDEGRPR